MLLAPGKRMVVAQDSVLLVDDEVPLVEAVRYLLEKEGFQVRTAGSGPEGLQEVRKEPPDLVLLDIRLPGMDGLEVCRRLRAEGFSRPILLLSSKDEEIDRVVGLEVGADDYVTKPYGSRELIARIRSHLRLYRRLTEHPDGGTLEIADLTIDPARREARQGETRLALTPREFELLLCLARHRDRAVSRDRLLEEVWGDPYGDPSIVNVAIQRLREKLAQPARLVTIKGAGYMLDSR